MDRRFPRVYARFPVDLVPSGTQGKCGQPASVIDVSPGGLRIQTCPRLDRGQVLHVFHEGLATPFARCRVVWAQTHGSALPSEAGLEILEGQPWNPAALWSSPLRPGRSL